MDFKSMDQIHKMDQIQEFYGSFDRKFNFLQFYTNKLIIKMTYYIEYSLLNEPLNSDF